jgi:heat-inducible transcriptional repressor
MLDARKSAVLRGVVNRYVETGAPVGSVALLQVEDLRVSPATVRAEMAELETRGYLTHPHTSSGRVPTDRGYRYFVDYLLSPPAGLGEMRKRVVRALMAGPPEAESVLERAARVLAALAGYGAVVVGGMPPFARIRAVTVAELAEKEVLVVLVLSTGDVERVRVRLEEGFEGPGGEGLAALEREVQSLLVGAIIGRGKLPVRTKGASAGARRVVEEVERRIAARRFKDFPVHFYTVEGLPNIVRAFGEAEYLSALLSALEEASHTLSVISLALSLNGMFAIGAENREMPWTLCSLAARQICVDGESVGLASVVGPTRMRYDRVAAALDAVADGLSLVFARYCS